MISMEKKYNISDNVASFFFSSFDSSFWLIGDVDTVLVEHIGKSPVHYQKRTITNIATGSFKALQVGTSDC